MLASWRFARNTLSGRHGRSVLLIAATAIACALVVAVSCCTGSAQGAMDGILKTILGPSDVRIIHQFGSRFDDSLLEESRGWPGVEQATGRLFASLTLVRADGGINPKTNLPARVTPKAIGVSLENEQTFRDLELREGRRLEAPDEILIDPLTAEQMNATIGDVLRVQRFGEPIDLTIVGIYERPVLVAVQRPQVRVDRHVIAEANGQQGQLTHIMMVLEDGVDAEAFCEQYGSDLSSQLTLEPAEMIRAGFDKRVGASQLGLILASILTFLSASFIIVTGLTTNVTERQRDMAIARCVGASRAQLFASQIVIGLMFAMFGSLIGIPVGIGLSAMLVWHFSDMIELSLVVPALGINLAIIGAASSGLLASLYPAWQASRVSPLEAMTNEAQPARRSGVVFITAAALALIAIQLVLQQFEDRDVMFWAYAWVGLPALYGGYFLLATPILLLLTRFIAPALATMMRIPVGMLRDSVSRQPYRHGFTAGALMVGIGILVSTWAGAEALLDDWIGKIKFADGFAYRAIGISPEQRQAIAEQPFVETTCPIGYVSIPIVGEQVFGITGVSPTNVVCIGFDPEVFFRINNVEFVEGTAESVTPRLLEGDGVVVEERFLIARDLGIGDELTLGAGESVHTFEIVGVIRSPGLDLITQMYGIRSQYMEYALSSVFLDRDTVQKHFDNDDVYMMQVNLVDDISDVEATARLEEAAPGVVFTSGRAMMDTISEVATTLLVIQSVIGFSALVLACIGVGNVIIAGIHGRRYEYGVLRAIGGHKSLLTRLVLGEAILLALAGAAVGTGLGMHTAWVSSIHYRRLLGIAVNVSLPEWPTILGWLTVVVLAMLASLPGLMSVLKPQPSRLLAAGRND